MLQLIFILPICKTDLTRSHYTVDSIRRHCERYKIYLVLDGIEQRSPDLPSGEDVEYFNVGKPTNGHWGKIWLNQMNAIAAAAGAEMTDENTLFIKIDADAVIVRDNFYERLQSLTDYRPNAGIFGQVYYSANGSLLSNQGHANYFKKTMGLRGLRLFFNSIKSNYKNDLVKAIKAWLSYRNLIKNNNNPSRFPIGGCYGLTKKVVRHYINNAGILDNVFSRTPKLGEDVITGLVFGAEFSLIDDTMNGGAFAVGGMYDKQNNKFRVNPIEIASRGHFVIHPTKFGYFDQNESMSEQQLIEQLKTKKL